MERKIEIKRNSPRGKLYAVISSCLLYQTPPLYNCTSCRYYGGMVDTTKIKCHFGGKDEN